MRDRYILMMGCFDTKGADFAFLYQCLIGLGDRVIAINTGVMGTTDRFPVDIESDAVATAAGHSLADLRKKGDRGYAMGIMGNGAAKIVKKLVSEGKAKGAIGMGGGGGTYIALLAMQEIPFGIPKLCLTTLATKDLSRQIGAKDIVLMPSVVDVAGLNSISALLIEQAAAAISGMARITKSRRETPTKRVAISMFGNTTDCVNRCSELLKSKGFEVFTFHANGVGGRTMESLIREKYFHAVLDITTTELADELCGGICSAGPDRLTAAAALGIPQVVVPGCLDMVNFAHADTVPKEYSDRELYEWAPDVTLMRTNEAENRVLGKMMAEKLAASLASVTILLPTDGLSQIDTKGGIFYRPASNQALFDEIKKNSPKKINIVEVNAHINDQAFSERLVAELLTIINGSAD